MRGFSHVCDFEVMIDSLSPEMLPSLHTAPGNLGQYLRMIAESEDC